ncbi:MAG: hypothetical protein KGS72_25610, partial [Cyanobacteria bacterium REEB67]|nr:hypothetical protein [Cyanobacteria bacterium REEB67]
QGDIKTILYKITLDSVDGGRASRQSRRDFTIRVLPNSRKGTFKVVFIRFNTSGSKFNFLASTISSSVKFMVLRIRPWVWTG